VTSKKILIIDDSPIDARFAAKMLNEAGFETVIAHDGLEGIELARTSLPDMVLLDVTMPKMDGYQVCERLKSDPKTREVLTVLYTVRDQFIDCLKGIEAGADDFITKTVSMEEFLGRIKRILSEQHTGAEIPVERLNMKPIALLAEVQDREDLVRTWYSAFNKYVRQAMSVILGTHATSVLVDRAMDKTSVKYPIFPHLDQGQRATFMFDPGKIKEITASELVEGYQTFLGELYQIMMKLTRTRPNGAKEARSIAKAFQEMLGELATEHGRAVAAAQERVSPAVASAISPVPLEKQAREQESRGAEETLAPAPPRPFASPPSVSLPSPECTLDASATILYANDDFGQALGYNKMELIGRPFITLLGEPSRPQFDEAIKLLGEKGVSQPNVQLNARDGSMVYATLRLTALYDTQGNFVMTRCNAHVVPDTERVKEKDREIERLKEAVHRANEELANVASTISHDLRQPLHAILVLCQFLQEETTDRLEERGREYLASIEKAASRMKQMVEDVVHYARITSSSNSYEEVDLNQLLDEVRDELAPVCSERRATLLRKGELPVVTCDRERFKELFTRLISNGIKFNDKEQPIVEVALVRQDASGYTFSVQDNGIGIEEPYHETIFRLFQRLHKPEEYSGTGAGLAICRRIVVSHDGRIWVRSQFNEGATFFFTLPVASQLLGISR